MSAPDEESLDVARDIRQFAGVALGAQADMAGARLPAPPPCDRTW